MPIEERKSGPSSGTQGQRSATESSATVEVNMPLIVFGAPLTVCFKTTLTGLCRAVAELLAERDISFVPVPAPGASGAGRAICPIHHARMGERAKQGDQWFSHRIVRQDGREGWCDGTWTEENLRGL